MKNPSRNAFSLVLTLVCLGFCFSSESFGQLSLTNANNTQTIDFSTTISGVINGPYTGAGFQPAPTAGQLDSDAWAATGMSDGDLAFGGTATTGDYARGATATAVSTGGFYAYTGAPGTVANPSFMFQPTGDDFTPGTLTLRIQNNGTTAINEFQISYEILVRNDQGRATSLNFEYSIDGVNFIAVTALNYTTPEAAVTRAAFASAATPSTTITLTGDDRVAPSEFFYIRWTSNDVSGSGSRDEIALDNIVVNATFDVITAAYASISGRVTNSRGQGLRNVILILTGGDITEPIYARTNNFGYYQFPEVEVGQTYVVQVMSKHFSFKEPAQVISLDGGNTVLNFTVNGRW